MSDALFNRDSISICNSLFSRFSRNSLFIHNSILIRIAFLLAVVALAGLPAAAQARRWEVADFKDSIAIAADGSALVSEKITVTFEGPVRMARTIRCF